MPFKSELPSPEEEILKQTMCDEHVAKRQAITPRDLESLNDFEKEKNCCPACEAKRIQAWGKPTDDDIRQKAEQYRQKERSDLLGYLQLIEDIKRRAAARDSGDLDTLDQMTWAQFDDCEHGAPFWTGEDYKKLLEELGEE